MDTRVSKLPRGLLTHTPQEGSSASAAVLFSSKSTPRPARYTHLQRFSYPESGCSERRFGNHLIRQCWPLWAHEASEPGSYGDAPTSHATGSLILQRAQEARGHVHMPAGDDPMPNDPDANPRQIQAAGDSARTNTAAQSNPPENEPRHPSNLAPLLAIFCTVFGAKLIFISTLGSPMPLIDQWDAEAANLYAPYLHGSLSVGDLFAPHNEHRLPLTRLLTLLHLELAGEWNPRLEMVLSALVHTAFIALLAGLLMPLVAPRRRILFACFTATVFALPLGYENMLLGFNFHFYLILFFGTLSLYYFASSAPFSRRWFGALVAAILSYLAFSSGVATILAAAVLAGLQLARGVRSRRGLEYVGIGVMVATAIAMILWIASAGAGSQTTAWSFIQGFLLLAGPTVIGVLLIQVPAIWYCRHTLSIGPPASDRAWLAVGIAGWVAIQLAIVAYGRGTAVGGRYIDLLLPVYPVALIAIFTLAQVAARSRFRNYATKGVAVWLFTLVASLIALGYYGFTLHAIDWNKSAHQQMDSVKAYLSTHDVKYLDRKAGSDLVDISYPNPARLAHILDNPDVREILPPEIRPADAHNADARKRLLLKGAVAGATATAVPNVLALGPAVLAVGIGLFFAVGARGIGYVDNPKGGVSGDTLPQPADAAESTHTPEPQTKGCDE